MTPKQKLKPSACAGQKKKGVKNRRAGLLKAGGRQVMSFQESSQLCMTEAGVDAEVVMDKMGKIAAIQTQRQGQNDLNYFCVEK